MFRRRIFLVAVLLLAALAQSLWASSVDLGDAMVYARRGFDRNLVGKPPAPGRGEWLALAPELARSLAIRDLGLPGVHRPAFFDLASHRPESFTIAFVFDADLALIGTTGLSVLVPQAGQGWALYLNGALIYDELHIAAQGALDPERALRNVVVPLDKRDLKMGDNVLAFHIYGDPSDERTGLPGGHSLRIDSYARLSNWGGEYLDIALIGVYALFALYHFVLFSLRPKQSSYLMYGLGALLFSAFLFARTATASSLILDTAVLRFVELGCVFFVPSVFIAFCEIALGRKASIVSKIGLALSFALACLLPFVRQEVLKLSWEILTCVELMYLFAFHFAPRLVELASEKEGRHRLTVGQVIFSDVGLLSFGALIFAAAAAVDAVAINAGGDMRFSRLRLSHLRDRGGRHPRRTVRGRLCEARRPSSLP